MRENNERFFRRLISPPFLSLSLSFAINAVQLQIIHVLLIDPPISPARNALADY